MLLAIARDAWRRSGVPPAFRTTAQLPAGAPEWLLLARGWNGPRDITLIEEGGPPVPIAAEIDGDLASAILPLPRQAGGGLRLAAETLPRRLWLLRPACPRPSTALIPASLRPAFAGRSPVGGLAPEALLAHLEAEGLNAALALVVSHWLDGEEVEAANAALLRHLGERPLLRTPLLGIWAALLARPSKAPA